MPKRLMLLVYPAPDEGAWVGDCVVGRIDGMSVGKDEGTNVVVSGGGPSNGKKTPFIM